MAATYQPRRACHVCTALVDLTGEAPEAEGQPRRAVRRRRGLAAILTTAARLDGAA